MSPNILILVAGAVLILIMILLWIWNHMVVQFHHFKQMQSEMVERFAHRRDVIPYLIESYRSAVPDVSSAANEKLGEIISQRSQTWETREFDAIWAQEQSLEEKIQDFYNQVENRPELKHDIGWLEAYNDIQTIHEEVEAHEKEYKDLRTRLEKKSKTFPFTLFSGSLKREL
ncbi:MAG: hypothetical protein ACD_28C00182G0002 [uncultured bacterium]|nr:MAG: hypothetical protein ACD_28C00182G0002 [uncultured bacterium]